MNLVDLINNYDASYNRSTYYLSDILIILDMVFNISQSPLKTQFEITTSDGANLWTVLNKTKKLSSIIPISHGIHKLQGHLCVYLHQMEVVVRRSAVHTDIK